MRWPALLAEVTAPEVPGWEVRDWVVLAFIGVMVTALWLYMRHMFDEKTQGDDRGPPAP